MAPSSENPAPGPSIYSRIIAGEIPGRFIWRDDRAVAIVDIRPLNRGHCLVIPVEQVDHWIDLPEDLAAHLMGVAGAVGRAQQEVFSPARIGLMIAGFEVPHTHLHVVPMGGMRHLDFGQADPDPDPGDLDEVATLLRSALRSHGHPSVAE
jgi:histidine triad (HIT) family protein